MIRTAHCHQLATWNCISNDDMTLHGGSPVAVGIEENVPFGMERSRSLQIWYRKSRLIALADDKDVDNKLLGNRQPEELDGEFARP
jgi:hypothetical protein